MDSKEISWKWVTADEILSPTACDLLQAHCVPSSANGRATLYNGGDTNAEKIVRLTSAAKTGIQFHPKEPVYCRRGLFVGDTSHIEGIFVQWRVRSSKEG
jgi:hypothetical protein